MVQLFGGGGCLRWFVLLICILILVHMSSVIFSDKVVGGIVPNPEDDHFKAHIESNFNDTIIIDPPTLSSFLQITRVTVKHIDRGKRPIVDLLSLWGNHQSNVVSCYPEATDTRSIDAWLQFKDVPHRTPGEAIWCSEFTRVSNCEFVSQFAYSTLIREIKHLFVLGDAVQSMNKDIILERLNRSLSEGWETLATRVKPILTKYRETDDREGQVKINEILIDLLRVGTLKSVGSSIPIGHLSSIYITGEHDVYKKNGVAFNDPYFNQAAFNLLFVFVVYDPASGMQHTICMGVDRPALLKRYTRNGSVSYWTGKFMDFTRTSQFMEIVKGKMAAAAGAGAGAGAGAADQHPWDRVLIEPALASLTLLLARADTITSNSAFTVGCKGICMLFHYTDHTGKIVSPPGLFYNAHDGIVGCSGNPFSTDHFSTSIFKLYPTFQVPTSVEFSQGYNIVNFKSNAIWHDFFYPPEYVPDMVDFVIGTSLGQTLSGSLNTLGLLTHDSLSQYTPEEKEEKEEMKGPPPPIFDDPANIPKIVKSLNAEAVVAAKVVDTKKSSGPLSFFKSIWGKILDILPISTIGSIHRSETNFFDTERGADFNKMFISFTLEICEEIESYVGVAHPEPNYEFATHHALATAKDLFQLCLPPPRTESDDTIYTKNWSLATNLLSNVSEFIKYRQREMSSDLLALAIFTARAIAYIYIDSTVMRRTRLSIIIMFNFPITPTTIEAFDAGVDARENLVSEVRGFLLRDASPEEEQGGGRRRTRRTLRRVSRKRYKKILTCPRRSRRRGSHRRGSHRRRSRRSYKIVAK